MIKIIIAVLIVAVLIYATTQPDTFRVERSINIKASPEKIFPFINDFHQWKNWSPWEKIDPAAINTHSGVERGVGAAMMRLGKGGWRLLNPYYLQKC